MTMTCTLLAVGAFIVGALVMFAWSFTDHGASELDAHARRQAGIRLAMTIARLEGPEYLDRATRTDLARELWRASLIIDPPNLPRRMKEKEVQDDR